MASLDISNNDVRASHVLRLLEENPGSILILLKKRSFQEREGIEIVRKLSVENMHGRIGFESIIFLIDWPAKIVLLVGAYTLLPNLGRVSRMSYFRLNTHACSLQLY